ncbi:MAG: hypothetical protein AAB409_00915 [Gemmatimonadota bacterium]
MRRLIALLLTVVVANSVMESASGLLRDGVIHHESASAADAHRSSVRLGDRGHEDGMLKLPHNGQHQHGTAADHCTHAHGPALLPGSVPVLAFVFVRVYDADPATLHGRGSVYEAPPPRA